MFHMWGFFFFIFPAIAVYYLVRHLLGPGRRGDRSRWISEFDDFNNPSRPDDQHPKGSNRVRIYKLAYKLKGRLTVSDIVIETGLDADEAEELIQSMVDNLRVRMEVMDDGLVVYEFPEIIARYKSQEGSDSGHS